MATSTGGTSTVTDHGGAQIPAAIRDRLGIDPGDQLRWRLDEDEQLRVQVVHRESGAFDDFEPGESDTQTNARELESAFGLG
jgi:antitoxin PrlF